MCAEAHIAFIFFTPYCYHEKYMIYFYERPIKSKALSVCVCVCVCVCMYVCMKKCRITYILRQSFHERKVIELGILLKY